MKYFLILIFFITLKSFSQFVFYDNKNFIKYNDEYKFYYEKYNWHKYLFVDKKIVDSIEKRWYNLYTDSVYYATLKSDFICDYSSNNSFLNKFDLHYKIGKSDYYGICGKLSVCLFKLNNFQKKLFDSTGTLPGVGSYVFSNRDYLFSINHEFSAYLKLYPFLYVDAGYNRHFVGDGYRSLFISDQGFAFPYVRGTATIWKIKYSVLYSFLKEPHYKSYKEEFEKKYTTSHYLNINVTRRLNFNAFEAVIWQPEDSIGKRGFDINYVNPFIFFRPIEWALGSPDNVLMGAGLTYKVLKTSYIYFQFLLDEFFLKEFKNKRGWWGNKYATQVGLKCYNTLNVTNFYSQLETNICMPFTYSHNTYLKNWGNNHYPLAHPLGSNFFEVIAILQYPIDKYVFSFHSFFQYQGKTDTINRGDNIYLSYNFKRNDYGNYLLTGSLYKNVSLYFDVHYLLSRRYFLYIYSGIDISYTSEVKLFFHIGITTGKRFLLFRNNL